MNKFSHFTSDGAAQMVDVGDKHATRRKAVAAGEIHMQGETLNLIIAGEVHKGDVLGIARIAGIMAAKKTAQLIPLCHPLLLTRVGVDFEINKKGSYLTCTASVECQGQTGVEMEALLAVQVALLTIYDMCKSQDRGMRMQNIRLLEKSGGKSGQFVNN